MYYCSQETGTGALLFSGEGKWCNTAHVFRRRGLVLYCSREKGDGAVPKVVLNQVYWLTVIKVGN